MDRTFERVGFGSFGCIVTILFFEIFILPGVRKESEPTNVSKALEKQYQWPEALPEGIIPIQIGPHFAKKIGCPICDKEAEVYHVEKFGKHWSFAYNCGRHLVRYDENMHLESIR